MKEVRRAKARALIAFAVAAAFAAFFVTAALGDDDPQPIDFAHNVSGAPAPVAGAVFGNGSPVKSGQAICTTPTQTTVNVNTDCETTTAGPGPHNETSIAVNPTDTNNMIGGVNDYQLGLNPGGHVTETIQSRAHVTFDGGKTWSQYPIKSNSSYQATGDPSLAFDDSGRAYYATLGFRFVGPANAQNPDVTVSTSTDKGKTWSEQVVAHGSGNATSVGDLLDKEYVTAWGDGNALVTYGDFQLGQKGSFVSARIYDSVTHDGGRTWSAPQVISGRLDEAFVSVPAITKDHSTVYVSFLNTTDLSTGRPGDRRPHRRPVQGRDDDRRRHGLPDRVRTADLPGQPLPFVGRGERGGRPDERQPHRRGLVRHAEQHNAGPEQSLCSKDELGHRRERLARRRPDVVGTDRAGLGW
jgi:hypothetical protein